MSASTTLTPHAGDRLGEALQQIAAGAGERDRDPLPRFPTDAIAALREAGALAFNAQPGRTRPPAATELELVRRVARADGALGRIFDGHLNAVERLAVQAPPELRDRELEAVRTGRLVAGVWGGDPRPGEGPPAAVARCGEVLRGVKTFCSGAGGLDRALVLARDPDGGPPPVVWIDLHDNRVEVDEHWYRGYGLRASVSHRVVFHDARILARFGAPGALAEHPWFSRDALRTASTWAGMADSAAEAACAELSQRPGRGALEGLAAARIETARRAISLWVEASARAMDTGDDLPGVALHARAGIARESGVLLDEASRACGSWAFARAGTLDRCRRDLEVFLLQHRLEPMLARAGTAALDAGDVAALDARDARDARGAVEHAETRQ